MSRLRRDHGATSVEFALVVLPFMMLVFGAVDFGLYEYQHSQAAAAARDGVRYAILHYKTADSGADKTGVVSEVNARLGLRQDKNVRVTVTCSTTPCSSASPGVDSITVQVQISYTPITPGISRLGAPKTITETSTQTIVGLPS